MNGGFQVRVADLVAIGKEHLPDARDDIRAARSVIWDSTFTIVDATNGRSDLLAPIADAMQETIGLLVDAMDENARVVDLSADAMTEIARRYQKLDGLD